MFKLLVFSLFVITLFGLNYVASESLADLAAKGDCKYYQEMEKIKNCGTEGYLTGYGIIEKLSEYSIVYEFIILNFKKGGKYCVKFGETSERFNQDVLYL